MSTAFAQMKQLSTAIVQGNLEQVKQLLTAHNAKEIVNLCDQDLYTSIFHTVKIPNEDLALQIMNLLLEKGANPYHKEENGQTMLSYLAKDGKAKMLERMLSGFNFDLSDLDKFQQTPLYWAASFGRLKVAELLIRFGCNINHLDQNGQTCLFYAARDGQLEMCKFLINRGCKHDLIDKNKKTPLHFAKQFKHPAVIDYLVSLKGIKAKPPKQNREKESKEPESRPEKVEKKKKEVRGEYVLVYTGDDGMVSEVSAQEIDQFPLKSDFHAKLWQYFLHPQKLEQIDTKNQKKSAFVKTANKLLTAYLKRVDLALFHFPVDTGIYVDYPLHVSRPMDFSTMRVKLNNNCYENEEEFRDDVVQIYDNCVKYNGELSIYGQMAKNFKMEFLDTFRKQFPL